MFQISRQVDYAVQLLARLATLKSDETLSLKTFSKESNISFLFLQKIARQLKRAQLIQARKGINGGYALAVPLEQISIRSVTEAVEGPYALVDCAKGEHMCSKSGTCKTKTMWLAINKGILDQLENTSIAHFRE